jgi:hypothetical protein
MPIQRIETPRIKTRSVIDTIPKPVTNTTPPPVVTDLELPVIDVPTPIIEYPVIPVPTESEWRQQATTVQPTPEESEEDTRELRESPPPGPTITIGGVEAPLPEPAPLITAGATAVVTTVITLGATIAVAQVKRVVEPFVKRALKPKKTKKIKIKQVKPVIHYVLGGDDKVYVFEYTQFGTTLLETTTEVERYIREQVDNDTFYEYDNKVIIDKEISDKFTKEGAKRFKSLFAPAKTIVKKLSAKFSF